MAESNRAPERNEQGWLALSLVWLLLAYQRVISPFLGENCRFHPTCSRYAIDAVVGYGAARGSWLALKRVCRCHPLSDGGLDPVP